MEFGIFELLIVGILFLNQYLLFRTIVDSKKEILEEIKKQKGD